MTSLRVLLISALLGAAALAAAEEAAAPAASPWKKQVVAKFNLNQAHFDNWAQGGTDLFSWQAGLYATFERDGAKGAWKNTLRSVYGRNKTEGSSSTKTTDELFLETVYTFKMSGWVNPYLAATAQTQMDKGYATLGGARYQISECMDPGYFTQSAGIAFDNKKGFTSRLGAAVKETVTSRFNGYADDPKTAEIEKTRVEPGVNSVTELKLKVSATALFNSKLDIFSNLKSTEEMYTRWSNMLTVKATKYIDMNAEFELLYDGHTAIRRQLRQAAGIGFTYSLF
jgi:hypothetical protein